MDVDALKKEFLPKYLSIGDPKFYRFLLLYAIKKIIAMEKESYNGIFPNLELMEYHDQFMILYRREGDEIYLQIAKNFRKAGHKIYRIMLKKDIICFNDKFLNLV